MNYVEDQRETALSQKAIELKRQFHEAGYDFIAIQEARSRYDQTVVDEQFLRFISAAKAGQGGLETWVNRKNFSRKTGYDLQCADCTTWYHDHRCLAIFMNAGGLELNIINIYAPQSGRTSEEIAQWWEQFHQIVKLKPSQAPMIILGDCNAKVGSVQTQGIRSVHEDFEDQTGQHVREFCEVHSLLVSSTFQDVHKGASATFHLPKGGNSRIDYIMIPSACADGICNTEVDDITDLLNGIGGRRPLVLRMQMQFQDRSMSGFVRKSHYDRTKPIQHLKEYGMRPDMHMEPIEWDIGVNTNWRTVKDDILNKAARCFPRVKRKQRQEYFDNETWQIVCRRKEIRAQHRELDRAWKYQVLRQCFKAWKNEKSQDDDWTDLHIHQLQMQQAICYEQAIRLQQDFRHRKRQNWKKWIEEQWEEKVRLSHNITGADVFKVFQPKKMIHKHQGKLRRPLPGLQDQNERWQTSRRQIAGSWQAQFGAIENAQAVTYQDLCKRSQPQVCPRDLAFLKQTPTRFEIEDAVRGLRTQKAPGADGVGTELLKFNAAANLQQLYAIFLKTAIRGQTPVDMTGGWLIPLHKGKRPACQMSGYRAVLLEATAARIFSRAWRKKIGYAADQVAAPMQMGGRPGQSIEMAHLHVRLKQSTSKAEGKSSAMLFVDLRSAFYTVVRQMLTGFSGKVQELVPIFQRLKLPPESFQAFLANVQEANLVAEATGSTAATKMIQTTLQQTWFAIPGGDSLFAPSTGSRPGDPLADWMFSLLVARMLEQINSKLETEEHFQDNLTLANNTTWVDDMVFMIEGEASTIVDKATVVVAEVLQICTEHGFRLSYGQGKTALMVDFRGAHSRKHRQQFEQAHRQMLPVITEYETVNVPLVSFYKHLGGHITRNGDVAPEIRTRAGQALARVVPLKRLARNKAIAIEQRRLILKSFIVPIVTLHSGTWFHLGLMEYKTWQAALRKIYACMHDRTQDGQVQHLTLRELAKHIQAPMPMEMLHVMKLRLCAQVLQSNDPFLISAILRNYAAAGQGSWLHGVFNSFQWLEDQIGGFDVPQHVRQLTDQTVWTTLQPDAKILRKQIKQAIKAHMW